MKRFIGAITFIAIIFFTVSCLHAQSAVDVSLSVEPSNPEPGTSATIRAISYGVDLDHALFSWTYNGVVVASGTGKTALTVIAPAAGATGLVSVSVSSGGFASSSASVLLRPASIDMLWEAADAITPPFYKGKALLPDQGMMRITAVPSGSGTQLSYAWTRNGSALPDLSGFGKTSITLKQDMLSAVEQFAVTAQGGLFSGTGSVSLTPQPTAVIAYKNDDGFIDYANGSPSDVLITGAGGLVHFEPYYFSTPTTIAGSLDVAMTSGGQDVTPTGNPLELGVARPDTGEARTVNVAITTLAYSLQHAQQLFTISFQ